MIYGHRKKSFALHGQAVQVEPVRQGIVGVEQVLLKPQGQSHKAFQAHKLSVPRKN
jgi:hypothetical protein